MHVSYYSDGDHRAARWCCGLGVRLTYDLFDHKDSQLVYFRVD